MRPWTKLRRGKRERIGDGAANQKMAVQASVRPAGFVYYDSRVNQTA